MSNNSQWTTVMKRYGIAHRSEWDISLGVNRIIRELTEKSVAPEAGHILEAHFFSSPFCYIFVNNKNIAGNKESDDGYFSDTLTECEITFWQSETNDVRYCYFVRHTHGSLIHGISWIKSGRDINVDSYSFNKIKNFIETEFVEPRSISGEDVLALKPTNGIWDGHGNRLGTMYNHVVNGFKKSVKLTDETIEKIVILIEEAFTFLWENHNRISEIINKSFNSQKV